MTIHNDDILQQIKENYFEILPLSTNKCLGYRYVKTDLSIIKYEHLSKYHVDHLQNFIIILLYIS